jgi:hypothetical protein
MLLGNGMYVSAGWVLASVRFEGVVEEGVVNEGVWWCLYG